MIEYLLVTKDTDNGNIIFSVHILSKTSPSILSSKFGCISSDEAAIAGKYKYIYTRSLGALRAPTSRLRPFGPALGPSGLLDNVLHALRALRPCDPRNSAMMG